MVKKMQKNLKKFTHGLKEMEQTIKEFSTNNTMLNYFNIKQFYSLKKYFIHGI